MVHCALTAVSPLVSRLPLTAHPLAGSDWVPCTHLTASPAQSDSIPVLLPPSLELRLTHPLGQPHLLGLPQQEGFADGSAFEGADPAICVAAFCGTAVCVLSAMHCSLSVWSVRENPFSQDE